MQEDFLHYIWKYKKIRLANLKTSNGEAITIISVGEHNLNSGPDFFNAKLRIGEQLWAGNLEIHLKSSDWFLHNHETDKAYDNVILHVVWEDDADIFRNDNSVIPTLALKQYINSNALNNYKTLFANSKTWINCEKNINQIDTFTLCNWLERLYFERLELKSQEVFKLLESSKNNWEDVLFKLLAKSFGLKVNGDAFLSMANSFNYSVLRKLQSNSHSLEALFMGQLGLLENDIEDAYYQSLKNEYIFITQKFNLNCKHTIAPSFFRLRPNNFPTIRLSQLASILFVHQNLFSKVIEAKTLKEIYAIFSKETSLYWQTHYTFTKTSHYSKKQVTKSFIDLVIINSIIPLKFAYAKFQGKFTQDFILQLIEALPAEKNSIVKKFNTLINVTNTALNSQALIQLKNNYCSKNKCLKCAIGNTLLNR